MALNWIKRTAAFFILLFLMNACQAPPGNARFNFASIPLSKLSQETSIDNPLWPCYWIQGEARQPGSSLRALTPSQSYLDAWQRASEGKISEAASSLERHYLDTERVYDLILLGNLYVTAGDMQKAENYWRKANATPLLLAQARNCLVAQKTDLARIYYDLAAQTIGPIDEAGYASLLLYYAGNGTQAQFEFAWDGYLRSASNLADSYEGQMVLGRALNYRRLYQSALPHFVNALRLRPDDAEALYEAGRLAFILEDLPGSQGYLMQCLERHSSCNRAEYYLGEIALQQGEYEIAYNWFKQVTEMPLRLQSMAKARLQQNNLDEARLLIDGALELEPDSIPSLKILSSICAAQGNLVCQIEAYKKILSMDPNDEYVLKRLKPLQSPP